MRKVVIFCVSLISVFFLLSSCHLLERREAKSEKGDLKRGIASDYSGSHGGKVPVFKFVRIRAGEFMMGSPLSEKYRQSDEGGRDGKPVRVEISKPFDMMITEVTQRQWYEVTGKNPSKFRESKYCANWDRVRGMCPDNPVEQVSWNEVQGFIKELNRLRGLRGCRGTPQDPRGCYRLPTEAEWEYAVRAGKRTAYFFGDGAKMSRGRRMMGLKEYAWYSKNSGRRTHVVRTRSSNPWGLHDVYGNVWEWVQDGYSESLPGGRDPLVISGSNRVLRGGSWSSSARYLRSAYRHDYHPGYGYYSIGFRLVRTL